MLTLAKAIAILAYTSAVTATPVPDGKLKQIPSIKKLV